MRNNLCLLDPLGKVLVLFGAVTLVPAALAWYEHGWNHGLSTDFRQTGTACLALGAACWWVGRGRQREFKVRHASMLVILVWFGLPLAGAMPLLSQTKGDFVDAYFEAVSGLTASGATVLTGIDAMPDAIKLWRGLLTWMGGLGLIVLAVAILPSIGVGGRQMMRTEITGPLKDSDLTPQINETAKGLWLVYAVLTVLCALAYFYAGMDLLDALVHSFTTLGLGGFSNHDASFAYFDSPLIEAIAVVFMLIAGFNFATHFAGFMAVGGAVRRPGRRQHGGPRHPTMVQRLQRLPRLLRPRRALADWVAAYRRDVELRPYLVVMGGATVLVCAGLWLAGTHPGEPLRLLREGVFNTVSIVTTTGYSSTDFFAWPLHICFFMLLLANFASCSGSTGGGVKMIRALAALGRLRVEQAQLLHPATYAEVKVGGRVLDDEVVSSILFFMLAYTLTVIVTTLLLLALQPGIDTVTAVSAAVACVSNTGPGLGDVGPASTYASFNDSATAVGALAMLLGRLELLLFLLLFSHRLWR